jgi:STAS-like domain of unknown function (DUF4325)
MRELTVSVFERTGRYGVSEHAGQVVHDLIAAALKEGVKVNLSFLNVSILSTAFLDSAIGQLYGVFSVDYIKSMLGVSDMQHDDIYLLQRIAGNAKKYFKNKQEESSEDR